MEPFCRARLLELMVIRAVFPCGRVCKDGTSLQIALLVLGNCVAFLISSLNLRSLVQMHSSIEGFARLHGGTACKRVQAQIWSVVVVGIAGAGCRERRGSLACFGRRPCWVCNGWTEKVDLAR